MIRAIKWLATPTVCLDLKFLQALIILAIDFPGGKRNRSIKISAQLGIRKCIAIVKEATRKIFKHVY